MNIQDGVAAAGSALLETIYSFDQAQMNTVPFEGSWTAGQVGDHVFKSASGVLHVVNGPSKATDRKVDEHVQGLKDMFLDFSTNMRSPMEILPTNEPLQRQELLARLTKLTEGLQDAAGKTNLEETCTAFEMPHTGFLTRIEWLNFYIVHTVRHIHQLQKIQQKLAGK